MPGNHGTPYDSHQGVVMLFGVEHGEPLAILDATRDHRDPHRRRVSGAATDALAREDAGDLALLGSGAQARTHLDGDARGAPAAARARVEPHAAPTPSASRASEGGARGLAIEVVPTAPRPRCAART